MKTKFRDPNDSDEEDEEEEDEAKEYRDKQDIQDELDMKRMMACGIVESLAASEFIKTQTNKNCVTIGNTMAYIAAAAVNKIFEEIK